MTAIETGPVMALRPQDVESLDEVVKVGLLVKVLSTRIKSQTVLLSSKSFMKRTTTFKLVTSTYAKMVLPDLVMVVTEFE